MEIRLLLTSPGESLVDHFTLSWKMRSLLVKNFLVIRLCSPLWQASTRRQRIDEFTFIWSIHNSPNGAMTKATVSNVCVALSYGESPLGMHSAGASPPAGRPLRVIAVRMTLKMIFKWLLKSLLLDLRALPLIACLISSIACRSKGVKINTPDCFSAILLSLWFLFLFNLYNLKLNNSSQPQMSLFRAVAWRMIAAEWCLAVSANSTLLMAH